MNENIDLENRKSDFFSHPVNNVSVISRIPEQSLVSFFFVVSFLHKYVKHDVLHHPG